MDQPKRGTIYEYRPFSVWPLRVEIVMGNKFLGQKVKCDRCGGILVVPSEDHAVAQNVPPKPLARFYVKGTALNGEECELDVRADNRAVAIALAKWNGLSVTECVEATVNADQGEPVANTPGLDRASVSPWLGSDRPLEKAQPERAAVRRATKTR